MRIHITILFLALIGCGRPNRACQIAEAALKQAHKEGSCESQSKSDEVDWAIWRFDDGERLCRDAIGMQGGPLHCTSMQPTKDEIADAAKMKAEADAKVKAEADAKLRAEADAKARADLDAKARAAAEASKP